MPGNTPLIGVQYPTSADPPDGAAQIETVVRALEKYGVLVAADPTARDALITQGLRHEGQLVYLTTTEKLQVFSDNAWDTVWAAGDIAVRRDDVLGDASLLPGRIKVLTAPGTQDTVWFSTGLAWVRLIDATDSRTAKGDSNPAAVTTSSVNGDILAGANRVFVDVVVPDSGRLEIAASALCKIDGAGGEMVRFGYEVQNLNGNNVVAYNTAKVGQHNSTLFNSCGWTSIVNVGSDKAGDTVRVFGVHSVSNNARTGTYTQREIVAVPVR